MKQYMFFFTTENSKSGWDTLARKTQLGLENAYVMLIGETTLKLHRCLTTYISIDEMVLFLASKEQ